MGKFKIYPLDLGNVTRPCERIGLHYQPGVPFTYPVLAFYITDGERKIMLDCGGPETVCEAKMPYSQTEEQRITHQLAKLGVSPDEIEMVVITHLHWDHAGNNHLFPNAKFYVQKDEIRDAAAPELKIFAGSYDYEQIFKTRYNVVDGDCQILDGIRVIKTPGHSMGSQSVIIDTEKGEYLLAGDLIGMFECMDFEPWVANSLHINLLDYYNSFEKVRKTGAFILPGHDYKVFEHAVYPF